MSEISIRDARADDCLDLWEWRNDPLTRTNSRSTEPVPLADHDRWFERAMKSSQTVMKLIEIGGVKAGVVRFDAVDQDANSWQISITIRPDFRGRGIGRVALDGCCQAMQARFGACDFVAEARTANVASRRIFEQCGFVVTGEADGFVTLRRENRQG